MAQYHGLRTRFLDWTHTALVGIYFVVETTLEIDGQLFALPTLRKAGLVTLAESPFAIKSPKKYDPIIVSPRIRAQEGVFVACSRPREVLSQSLSKTWQLESLLIPAVHKEKIRYEPFRLGVHASSLFPDIDGLAARVRWQHTVSSSFTANT